MKQLVMRLLRRKSRSSCEKKKFHSKREWSTFRSPVSQSSASLVIENPYTMSYLAMMENVGTISKISQREYWKELWCDNREGRKPDEGVRPLKILFWSNYVLISRRTSVEFTDQIVVSQKFEVVTFTGDNCVATSFLIFWRRVETSQFFEKLLFLFTTSFIPLLFCWWTNSVARLSWNSASPSTLFVSLQFLFCHFTGLKT